MKQQQCSSLITGLYKDEPGQLVTDPAAVTQFKSILGVLMHIMNYTRPDVTLAVNYLARFVSSGYVVQCGLGSIAWLSVRQPTVSRSTV